MRPYKCWDYEEYKSFLNTIEEYAFFSKEELYPQESFKLNKKILKTSINEWLSLWSIDINLAKIVSIISSNSIRNEMKIGNIPIGPLNNRKWERVHSIISSIPSEIENIPSKIDENTQRMKIIKETIINLQNEMKQLKEETKILKKKGSTFYKFKKDLPDIEESASILSKEEFIISSKVQEIIDNEKVNGFTSLNESLELSCEEEEKSLSLESISYLKPSISYLFNICELSPSIIDTLKSMNGNTFISCDLRNYFKPEQFQSFEFLDVLYCKTMINERFYPFQDHQSIKSIEDLENEFIDISKKEEYIDDNTFIISEHANIFKKLKEINDIHIGIEKCNENINFDDLPFKFKFKYLLKQFEDIEMKCDELNIKIYYEEDENQKQDVKEEEDNIDEIKNDEQVKEELIEDDISKVNEEIDENDKQVKEEEEEEVDMDKIKRKMIKNINKIIKKLNKHLTRYINDKTIKYENEILEKHLNRKYSNALEKFENIESKVILRREEKALKDKEKEYDKVNTMLNIHQIKNSSEDNNNRIFKINDYCKVCSCKTGESLYNLFSEYEKEHVLIDLLNNIILKETQKLKQQKQQEKQQKLENEHKNNNTNDINDDNEEEEEEIRVNLFSLIDELKLTGSRLLMLNQNDLMNEYYPFKLNNRFISERIINEINETFYTIHKESLEYEEFECMEPDDISELIIKHNSKEKHEEDSKYPLLVEPSMFNEEYTCKSCGTHKGHYMCFSKICNYGSICIKCLTCDICSTKYNIKYSPFHNVE